MTPAVTSSPGYAIGPNNVTSLGDTPSHACQPAVVIGHPYIGRGGSEARVMWLIEALKQDFDLTLVTTGGWDLEALNDHYGTQVSRVDCRLRVAPVPFLAHSFSAAALRSSCYQRFARRIAGEYAVRISAYNLTDWGMPAIHFIADFSWDKTLRERLHPPSPGLIYRDTILRKAYLLLASAFETPSGRDVLREDLVIANSRWSAALLKQDFGVANTPVIYPSVGSLFPDVPWGEKEMAFAMIGRIVPEKQIECAIAILNAVRQHGHDIRLHLCGHNNHDLYGRHISTLCTQHASWIIQEGSVSGKRKADILARCQFGIQTCTTEAFGISVAEMVRAGAIVFAPNNGGQTEIINSPDLLFSDADDAVRKICSVLTSTETQTAQRAHLANCVDVFSADRFITSAHELVVSTLNEPRFFVNPRSRLRLAIGHPHIGRGGSESTVMWLIEALKINFDITVVTTGGWDLAALNEYYGTHVENCDVTTRIAPVPLLPKTRSAAALRGACFQSFARKIAAEYDLCISAYSPTDWGLPAVHFIADFSWHSELRRRLHPLSPGFIYRNSPLRWAYLKIASAFGEPSGRDVLKDDILIANSNWSAALLRQICGANCTAVVYPPVWGEFPSISWDEKELAFVMIGRIAPEKRIEWTIEILSAVRQRGYPVRLHLCGPVQNDLYGRKITRLCNYHAHWIVMEGFVSGSRKAQVLSHCRYGIQTCAAEAFGISVAEMVKAGGIVFAPDNGGQIEVLQSPDLLFADTNDAVDKICAVLSSAERQRTLLAHLAICAEIFSADKFKRESLAAIEATLFTTPAHNSLATC